MKHHRCRAAGLATAVALLPGLLPTAAATPCPALGAHYALQPDPRFRIVLEAAKPANTASDLQLHLQTPDAHHVFAFTQANGYGGIRLIQLNADGVPHGAGDDPDEGIDDPPPPAFHAFDARLHELDTPPQAASPAPEWLFVPELGALLWYRLLEGEAVPERETMPGGMFRRVACAP